MTKFEFDVDSFLIDPGHKLRVDLIGAGGTGSQVASILARMNIALKALNHPGFDVRIFDYDTVSESNIGRQLYALSEIGFNKAQVTVNRLNRFFGTYWSYQPTKFSYDFQTLKLGIAPNIVISCVDTIKSRVEIEHTISKLRASAKTNNNEIKPDLYPFIWLDFGNGKDFGQAIMNYKNGKFETQSFLSMYPEVLTEEESNEPSCSLAEALKNQDLLINSTLGNLGMNLIWKILRSKKVKYTGVVLNLDNLNSRSIKLKTKKND